MATNGQKIVTGRVVSANDKGVKLDMSDDWFNYSKWADAELRIPVARGDVVDLTLDRSGFIRSCVPNGAVAGAPADRPAPQPTARAETDRRISRLAILKAAAEFGASRPNLKSGDVLTIADSWERWIYRDDDATETVADVF
jgi:hypothetical protein